MSARGVKLFAAGAEVLRSARFGALAVGLLTTLALANAAQAQSCVRGVDTSGWVRTWQTAMSRRFAPPGMELPGLNNQTLRTQLRVTLGGTRLRVRFSNEYGSKFLHIGAASVALASGGTPRPLTFNGSRSVNIPPGTPLLSDPVDLAVRASERIAIYIYLPEPTQLDTQHMSESNDALIYGPGDFTMMPTTTVGVPTSIAFVSGVDVQAGAGAAAVVVLGESRTEGNGRWPELVYKRMAALQPARSIVNASAQASELARGYPYGSTSSTGAIGTYDRDVLSVSGAGYVMLVDSINDIGHPGWGAGRTNVPLEAAPSVQDVIGTYRQLIERAHGAGLKAIGGTLMPFKTSYPNFYSAEKEAKRQAINQWIRTSKAFDGVVDFDAIVRDPQDPTQYRPGFGTRGGYDPSPAGESAIANAIDLALFRSGCAR